MRNTHEKRIDNAIKAPIVGLTVVTACACGDRGLDGGYLHGEDGSVPAFLHYQQKRRRGSFGPFRREETILQTDASIGTGAGRHSVVRDPRSGEYLIVYHRHPLGSTDGNHRVVCIDPLVFTPDGKIAPVRMH